MVFLRRRGGENDKRFSIIKLELHDEEKGEREKREGIGESRTGKE